ncbi:heterokaryon incompatibility protein-domain-containing protein, partial [Leptodontidium sp. MPI-SDFR-AT-0119]
DQRQTIWIDRKQVLIGSNLYDALLHIRDEEEPIQIWADAICINQLDFTERNHQVYIMRDIYSKADRTVIYLGADNGGYTLLAAWNFLERECNDRAPVAERPGDAEFRGDISDVEISVLSRPWFRRVWVFQEVIVSKRPLVQCGWRKTTWDSFCKVILLRPRLNDRYGWSLSKKPLVQYVADMFLARCAFLRENKLDHLLPSWFDDVQDNIGKGSHILTTLSRARRLESSDSRDKIYAVLGISSGIDLNNDRIAIDYNKTMVQLYTDFAQYLIYSTQSYDVLSYVERRQFPLNATPRWQSWVADWS